MTNHKRHLNQKNTNRNNNITIMLLRIRLRLFWLEFKPQISIFWVKKSSFSVIIGSHHVLADLFYHSWSINTQNQVKGLHILMYFCNNSNLEGQNLKIAISAQKSKTACQILDILSIFIQIIERNPQELGGSGGNVFFLTALKITFWLILAWKILRYQKFLFLWITYGLYHNSPQ